MPLTGVRVIDLARVMAGPSCAQMLGDFGADVIRVEDLQGDETRRWFPVKNNQSPNYQSVNRNKRGIALNLKTDEGQKILHGLVKCSDVLLHAFLPSVARRLKVDYESMRAINPDLICCQVSGFGAKGEMTEKPGYDLMVQAYAGIMDLTGDPDGPPMRAGISTIDLSTGMLAVNGILLALLARKNGKARGQNVNVSLLETSMALLAYHITNYTIGDKKPRREGSGVGHIVPYQSFLCQDGYILAGATNDEAWQSFCRAIDAAGLAKDERFLTTHDRLRNKPELIPLLQEIFAKGRVEDWVARLEEHRVPCAPVRTLMSMVDDPQVRANDMIIEAQSPDGVSLKLVGTPIKLSETPSSLRYAPPLLGQHSDEVLSELLGYTPAQLFALRDSGVIG